MPSPGLRRWCHQGAKAASSLSPMPGPPLGSGGGRQPGRASPTLRSHPAWVLGAPAPAQWVLSPSARPGWRLPQARRWVAGVLQSQQEALPRADFLEEGAQLGTPTRTKPQTNPPPVPSLKLLSDLQILSLELETVCAPTSSSGAPLGPFSSITKYPHRSYLHPRLQGCPLRRPQ